MAENNVTWKGGAGFSEECTKQINSYFKTFESIILLSRDREPQLWRYADLDIQVCKCAGFKLHGEPFGGELIDAIILDVFNNPGILPEMLKLRDRVLKLQQAAKRVLDISFCKDFGEMCIESSSIVIESLDNEIKNLLEEEGVPEYITDCVQELFDNEMTEYQLQLQEGLQEDKMTAVVSCPPTPVKEPEKPEVEAVEHRESFFFSRDLLAKGNDCGHLLKMLVQAQVLVVKDWNQDLNTLNTFLFGGHDLGGMLTVKKGGLGGLRTFVSVLADRSKNKELTYSGQINSTIRKWFIQENGKLIGMTTMRGVKSDTSVYDHTIEFCKTENYWNEQGNVSGETMRESGYRKTTLT